MSTMVYDTVYGTGEYKLLTPAELIEGANQRWRGAKDRATPLARRPVCARRRAYADTARIPGVLGLVPKP